MGRLTRCGLLKKIYVGGFDDGQGGYRSQDRI
jgi:hypothetical protein